MFSKIDEMAEELKNFKTLVIQNIPAMKEKFSKIESSFEDLRGEVLDLGVTIANEIQFNAFSAMAPFFVHNVEVTDPNTGAKTMQGEYLAEKHATMFMACRQNFEAVVQLMNPEEADGDPLEGAEDEE